MKTRCIQTTKKGIIEAIQHYNLETSGEGHGSGSMDHLRWGGGVDGGFLMKDSNNETLGWCVAFDNGQSHVYVRPEHRNKGYASQMLQKASEKFKGHTFLPWDSRSLSVFKKNKVKTSKSNLPWHLYASY